MSEKQHRDKIVSIKRQQATEEAALAKARAAAAKYRADSRREVAKITPRTSTSMARTYQRNAESAEARAVAEDAKIAKISSRLASLARDLSSTETNLDREVRAAARREDEKRNAAARRAEQEAKQRHARERRHAQEIARLSSPTVHYVHEVRTVPVPKPEMLRVLYLTADPERDLRTEVEVRDVQQAVRKATHRDLIQISYRPAATPEDLLDGLNELRPHVVHFSGHGDSSTVFFDNASVEAPGRREVAFDLLARALRATADPPTLLVLNGCDTLDGAAVLLDSTPVIIAMASEITDLAASVFAAKFYSAIASAQPVGPAVQQGSVALDLAGMDEGWIPSVLARKDLDLDELVLVQLPQE